jgi:PAS domain-containing protein
LALASDTHLVLQMNRAGDIEDDRRTAETVRESERQWQEVFEHNPLMYFMVDGRGTVRSVNTFGASKLGYGVGDLVERSLLDGSSRTIGSWCGQI